MVLENMTALSDKRLLIVSGKGGVGKSTIAAALGLSSARAGHRSLICEVNAQERISVLLGHSPSGAQITALEENLWSVNLSPSEALREYALMRLKFESIYSAVFENRLTRYFLRFIPSVQEVVMLGKLLFHVQERLPDGRWRFERVVLDAPATGHAVSFLRIPQVLLDTVPPGPLSREAENMRDLLVDEVITAAVLVAMPEEMPVNETLELELALRERVKLRVAAIVLNGFITPRFTDTDLALLSHSPALRAEVEAHRLRSSLSAHYKSKLEQQTHLEVHCVPRLYHPIFGRASIEAVADTLGQPGALE